MWSSRSARWHRGEDNRERTFAVPCCSLNPLAVAVPTGPATSLDVIARQHPVAIVVGVAELFGPALGHAGGRHVESGDYRPTVPANPTADDRVSSTSL
jgi:hypothetical protein